MISLAVDGSPSGCRQAARDLRVLRTRLTTLADEVAVVRTASSGAWTGLAGERFRTRTGSLVTDADEQAEVLAGVAAALDTLADRLDGVRAAMTAARMTAVGAGIPVSGDALPSAAGLLPDQLEAHARALTAVGHAREREAEAQQQWTTVLSRRHLGAHRRPTRARGDQHRARAGGLRGDQAVRRPAGGAAARVPGARLAGAAVRAAAADAARRAGGSARGWCSGSSSTCRRRCGSRWTTTPTSTA